MAYTGWHRQRIRVSHRVIVMSRLDMAGIAIGKAKALMSAALDLMI